MHPYRSLSPKHEAGVVRAAQRSTTPRANALGENKCLVNRLNAGGGAGGSGGGIGAGDGGVGVAENVGVGSPSNETVVAGSSPAGCNTSPQSTDSGVAALALVPSVVVPSVVVVSFVAGANVNVPSVAPSVVVLAAVVPLVDVVPLVVVASLVVSSLALAGVALAGALAALDDGSTAYSTAAHSVSATNQRTAIEYPRRRGQRA